MKHKERKLLKKSLTGKGGVADKMPKTINLVRLSGSNYLLIVTGNQLSLWINNNID